MIVYTQGSFDLLHIGHINLFRRCREIAGDSGRVVVAILSDEAYEKYRGYPSIIPFNQRKIMVESCRYVDIVIKSNNLDTKNEVEDHGAKAIVVGSDWATKDLAEQYGVSNEWLDPKLIYVPYTKDVSSTKIKRKIVD